MPDCSLCGSTAFTAQPVLWPGLVAEWQLAPEEVAYVDAQQGMRCDGCGASLRAVALGLAVGEFLGDSQPIALALPAVPGLRVLDLNGIPALSSLIAAMPNAVRADYPAVDMQAMPWPDASFDLVLHSDTLEHIPNPLRALAECRRILRPGGRLCYTVPTIIGRLSRSRAGLPASFHGNPETATEDHIVQTEFGADAWTYPLRAGFERVMMHQVEFPAATAISAW